jgi:hypothetical protein
MLTLPEDGINILGTESYPLCTGLSIEGDTLVLQSNDDRERRLSGGAQERNLSREGFKKTVLLYIVSRVIEALDTYIEFCTHQLHR